MWFENGTYIGHLPPGTFSEGEALTQQKIREVLLRRGYRDPQYDKPHQTIEQAIRSVTGKRPPIYNPWEYATATASTSGSPMWASGSWTSNTYASNILYDNEYKNALDSITKRNK